MRNFIESNGLPTDRISLKDLGSKRISEDAMKFLKDVLSCSDLNTEIIIIEGIRHRDVLDALKSMFKVSCFIYCETSFEERYKRYIDRGETKNLTIGEFQDIDNHSVEQKIEKLKKHCEIVINEVDISTIKFLIESYYDSKK